MPTCGALSTSEMWVCYSTSRGSPQRNCKGYAESNASYFISLACDISDGCQWYGSRDRTFLPTLNFIAVQQMAIEGQSNNLVPDMEACMNQKCGTKFLHEEKITPTDIQ